MSVERKCRTCSVDNSNRPITWKHCGSSCKRGIRAARVCADINCNQPFQPTRKRQHYCCRTHEALGKLVRKSERYYEDKTLRAEREAKQLADFAKAEQASLALAAEKILLVIER
eukprot:gb/GEZN01028946.1/.p1 GENE.gb/GEZN01028946.1/~~gb/GEZN01028946.1/.p1  ORF type:complete len:121 (-),score=7.17 gb/GEZN01028946.1/:112-453(-)